MTSSFEKELKNAVEGEVYFDAVHRNVYSVDASIYEIEPLGVLIPKTKEDIIEAIKIASHYRIPITARGAATGITGGCLGKSLIIDHSVHLNHIEATNFREKYAICQPGVVQDTLNKVLGVRNFRLGPDTSTGDRATLGGMMANNSAGARSLYYGKMVDHVVGIELVLASGECIYFTEVGEKTLQHKLSLQNTEGHIYREVCRIRDQYREEIKKKFPNIPRRVSGYNLDELIKPGPLNICKLITGSEGTLGFATQIKVNITEMPFHHGLCIIFFHSMQAAMESIATIMEHQPMSLELIDDHIIERGRASPSMRGKLDWLKGHPKVFLVAEFQASNVKELNDKLHHLASEMKKRLLGYETSLILDPREMHHVWDLRKSGLGLLLSKRSYSRAIAFIEDLSIDPVYLPSFMQKFQSYLKDMGKEAGIYGHVGSGCLHVRPYIDLRHPDELSKMQKMMEDISDMVLEHHGAMSGEHGDGLVRTWLNKKMFGETINQAFEELKEAFDPQYLMNPGKIVEGGSFLEHLRLFPEKPINKIETFLDFSKEGGFELAADLCNGNGLCRKSEGVMCPSFQATQNEFDSTRARAQALRAMIHNPSSQLQWAQEGLKEVLDLCLQCKGCKTECPSQVDMAKMKVEFLYQYQKKHGVTLRNRMFGHLSHLFYMGSKFPRLSNFLSSNPLSKMILEMIGVSTKRKFPQLSHQTFSRKVLSHLSSQSTKGQVVLFNDTFTEFSSPSIGLAAVKVLQELGYEVLIPPWKCCGRPLISKGFLPEARVQAQELIQALLPYAEKNIPIIGLEPSCLFTILDDYPALIPQENFQPVLNCAVTFDKFISQEIVDQKLPLHFQHSLMNVRYHVHCYQKSLAGSREIEAILHAIPKCEFSEIKSGCCGMAGSFGYEKEHYEISMQIGNLSLFPIINYTLPSTIVIANGFSCRSQIEHGTHKNPVHLAEFLAQCLDSTPK